MIENSINKKIGTELIDLINKNASIFQLSLWADRIYSNHCRELDSMTEEIITKISFMQHGPEFEIGRKDLQLLAKKLIES